MMHGFYDQALLWVHGGGLRWRHGEKSGIEGTWILTEEVRMLGGSLRISVSETRVTTFQSHESIPFHCDSFQDDRKHHG